MRKRTTQSCTIYFGTKVTWLIHYCRARSGFLPVFSIEKKDSGKRFYSDKRFSTLGVKTRKGEKKTDFFLNY